MGTGNKNQQQIIGGEFRIDLFLNSLTGGFIHSQLPPPFTERLFAFKLGVDKPYSITRDMMAHLRHFPDILKNDYIY
jgi:hypothetical protein